MNLKETLKKQGGFRLVKQYVKNHALTLSLIEVLSLGKSRTSLEIVRLSAQLKAQNKLRKKYNKMLDEFDLKYHSSTSHKKGTKLWFCWLQGIDNAPDVVKKCYESIKRNIVDREVVLIDYHNVYKFIAFPEAIKRKIDSGIISGAHLSDLIRLELLVRYGGTWIDATVYCSDSTIPSYMLDSDLFMFQTLKPGRDGHCTTVSNWFITASVNNKLLSATRYLLYKYWAQNDELVDYFVFHMLFQLVRERYDDEWRKVVPFSNSTPHILLLRLFEEYDEEMWEAIKVQTPFHKLSHKIDDQLLKKKNTYYQKVILGG